VLLADQIAKHVEVIVIRVFLNAGVMDNGLVNLSVAGTPRRDRITSDRAGSSRRLLELFDRHHSSDSRL
jgi:hypothetical protein